MGKQQDRSDWLSQQLLAKSMSMALQDPVMSMKLASLAMRAWLRYGGEFNPYFAAEEVRRSRKLKARLPPAMERQPEPAQEREEDEAG
jgi:hypothetical protein